MAPHELILLLQRANGCNVLHRINCSDQILCESRLTKREYVALHSTAHITCHPRGANVWPRSLTENAEPVRFDHTAKGTKALIVVGPVEMALLPKGQAITSR